MFCLDHLTEGSEVTDEAFQGDGTTALVSVRVGRLGRNPRLNLGVAVVESRWGFKPETSMSPWTESRKRRAHTQRLVTYLS